jgi:hypothetical protein
VDYLAFALWIATVVLFLWAAAAPIVESETASAPGGGPDPSWFARVRRAVTSAAQPDVIGLARNTAVAAAGLTIVCLLLTAVPNSADADDVSLRLAAPQLGALQTLCGQRLQLIGRIPTATLDDEFITFNFKVKSPKGCDAVRIPRAAVLAVREHPPGGG